MDPDFSTIVGSRLREVRTAAGFTVNQFSKLFDCSEDHYRRIERGIYTLSLEKLARLYSWAGIDPLFLITGKRRWLDSSDGKESEESENLIMMKQLIGYCNSVAKEG